MKRERERKRILPRPLNFTRRGPKRTTLGPKMPWGTAISTPMELSVIPPRLLLGIQKLRSKEAGMLWRTWDVAMPKDWGWKKTSELLWKKICKLLRWGARGHKRRLEDILLKESEQKRTRKSPCSGFEKVRLKVMPMPRVGWGRP